MLLGCYLQPKWGQAHHRLAGMRPICLGTPSRIWGAPAPHSPPHIPYSKTRGMRSPRGAPASFGSVSQITPNMCLFSKHFLVTMEHFTYVTTPAFYLPNMPDSPPRLTLSPRATTELLSSLAHKSGQMIHRFTSCGKSACS